MLCCVEIGLILVGVYMDLVDSLYDALEFFPDLYISFGGGVHGLCMHMMDVRDGAVLFWPFLVSGHSILCAIGWS
jgi:hypothetical protein